MELLVTRGRSANLMALCCETVRYVFPMRGAGMLVCICVESYYAMAVVDVLS